jgi:hypothetical protein
MNEDRTVHAVTREGAEVVRYDRAGKWYIEWPAGTRIPRKHIGINEAVNTAVTHCHKVNLDLPGGSVFDAKVRKLRGFRSNSTIGIGGLND